jgi:hypothetical protein
MLEGFVPRLVLLTKIPFFETEGRPAHGAASPFLLRRRPFQIQTK